MVTQISEFMKNLHYILLGLFAMLLISCETEESLGVEQDSSRNKELNGVSSKATNTALPNRFQYFHKGLNSNRVYSSYSSTGIGSWLGNFFQRGKTRTGIAATQFGNRIFIAHKGETKDNVFYSYSFDGRNFLGNLKLPTGAETRSTPELVSFNNKLFLYHKGRNTNKLFYNYTIDGINWIGNKVISDGRVKNIFHFNSFDNKIYFFDAIGNRVLFSTSTDGINFIERGSISFDRFVSSISTAKLGNTVHILVANPLQTTNGVEYSLETVSTQDFITFSQPRTIFINGRPIKTDKNPTIASDGTKLVIAYEESDGTKIRSIYSTNGRQWIGGNIAKGKTNTGVKIIYTK